MFCGECKKECSPIVVDFGIGPYEFWGAKYVDSHPACVSDCCEAIVFTDEECECEYTMTDFNDDNYEDQPILGDG